MIRMTWTGFFLFAAITSIIIFPRASDANILLTGGTFLQRQMLQAEFDSLPVSATRGELVTVQILSADALEKYVRSGLGRTASRSINIGAIEGIYQNVIPTITLRDRADNALLRRTFAHEWGHVVWQRELSDTQKNSYAAVYTQQKAVGSLISDYASTNVEEGFAESYAFAVTNPGLLQLRDPLSSGFIHTVVGGN